MLGSVSNSHSVTYSGQSLHKPSVADENHENESKYQVNPDAEPQSKTDKTSEQQSKEELLVIQKLKQRDQEVKAHEQAHLSAAGNLASGGVSFTYTQGPNGVRYATGGEVGIDTSSIEGDPAATLRKADAIRRAALAPMSPSSQDQLVAARATVMSNQAQADLSEQIQDKREETKQAKTDNEADQTKPTSPTSSSPAESNLMKGNIIDIAA